MNSLGPAPDAGGPLAGLGRWVRWVLDGEMARAPRAEQEQLQTLQLKLMWRPITTMMMGLALAAGTKAALVALGHLPGKTLPEIYLLGAATLAAMALVSRRVRGIGGRQALGFAFLLLYAWLMLGPLSQWQGAPGIALGPALLLPVTVLPMVVRLTPALMVVFISGLGLAWWLLRAPELTDQARLALVLLLALSVGAGILLRSARSTYALFVHRSLASAWQSATTDVLTGLFNRRGGLEAAEHLLASPQVAPVAMAFVDVDHFKQLNDAHGHAVGDELLASLGQILQGRIGSGDIVMRLGGEEFACLLPGHDAERATAFAQRICRNYRDRHRAYESTLSVGIAIRRPGEGLDALLARADAALYRAKREGRDRVVVAEG